MQTPKYRVGNSDRSIGEPANPPDGFIVVNLANKQAFLVLEGVWVSGSIPDILKVVWTQLATTVQGDFTYFVDPVGGNDSNSGTETTKAWLTTDKADTQVLSAGETIGYLLNGEWLLYRTPDMTVDMTELTADLITAGTDIF